MGILPDVIKSSRWLMQISCFLTGVAALFTLCVMANQVMLYQKYHVMIDSIETIRQHEYTDSYECLDFSKDLYGELEGYGLKSNIDIVRSDTAKSEYHAVISFQIDPQNGKLVDQKRIDSCRLVDGKIACDNGSVESGNMYIASNNK